MHFRYLLCILLSASVRATQLSSTLTQVTDFGPNPRNVSMYIYVPNRLPPKAPILVVPHWCHGDAQAAFTGRPYAIRGDQYGFISIYPDSPNLVDKCWDVSSNASLHHDAGGDALGIVSMVRWTLEKYDADKDRVFVTGTSSGAMMTNVLAGSYPDVFAAGSAWAGVPFGCFAGDGYAVWSNDCATGKIMRNGSAWAKMVLDAYPGYEGVRPKMQVLHGTNDTVLYPPNLKEEIKQWASVFGISDIPTERIKDTPLPDWTKSAYGDRLEAYEAKGVDHNIPNQADVVLNFFDLKCNSTEKRCFSRESISGV
ncbi:alpha/beta-hydrolase [Polyplosphaeria fusca]|uniref:Carboxylic ester hydrolase n=1 Tax=Polyplosphaeria fusca TaxID=682080 RepID=A0A9P4QZL5_9PLEO|nr:alpha/beta-hydrolase [Polyplosphaeria fusca]